MCVRALACVRARVRAHVRVCVCVCVCVCMCVCVLVGGGVEFTVLNICCDIHVSAIRTKTLSLGC